MSAIATLVYGSAQLQEHAMSTSGHASRAAVRISAIALFSCALMVGSFPVWVQAAAAPSLVIVGAEVADGSGAPLRKASVRIRGERIEAIGDFAPQAGETVLQAAGLVLAPGFIDTHNHSEDGLETQPLAETQISQGITTLLLGQDGGSPWPLGAFLQKRRDAPPALNVAICVGHATVRQAVMGEDHKRAARATS
jgi:N-acyl-D-amino-acid deacylase